MTEFARGDRVKIIGTEHAGTIVGIFLNGPTVDFVPSPDGIKCWPTISGIPLDWLELVEPHSWPPQKGDIWEADGQEYFVRVNYGHSHEVVIGGVDRNVYYREGSGHDEFMTLKPVLVRRKGVNP